MPIEKQPPRHVVELTLDQPLDESIDPALLIALAEQTLATEPAPPGRVSLVITDDATVQALNRDYRDLDEPTDVLSFGLGGLAKPLEESSDAGILDEPFIMPPDEALEIGEVIIAQPYAARHAAATNRPLRDELALLVVHGVLHLLGHDHLEADEEAAMQARERAVLGVFGIGRG